MILAPLAVTVGRPVNGDYEYVLWTNTPHPILVLPR